MTLFQVPGRDQVAPANQAIFDNLKQKFGFVPNLYATFALSERALNTYLALQNSKSSIGDKARNVIHLVVSQVNGCTYCLAAHTAVGKMLGFSEAQMLEIRRGRASWDGRLDALARMTRNIATERGHADSALVDAFFAAGWTQENLVDAIVIVGDKTISNYLHSTTRIATDFPAAPAL